MTRTQGLTLVLACVLLLALLTGTGRVAVPHAGAPGQAARIAADPAVDALAGQALRLREHLGNRPPLAPSRRNPFTFLEPTPTVEPAAGRPAQNAADTAAMTEPLRPDMRLQGIAEDPVDGRPVRKAVLSVAGELFIVAEGDRVLGRYEVVRVAADAVELKDGGGTFTLALR